MFRCLPLRFDDRPTLGRWGQALVLVAALASGGCGKSVNGAKVPSGAPQAMTENGRQVVKFGFGAEGGESPALAHTADGWQAIYAGTQLGDRHLYWSTSADGSRWSTPSTVASAQFSDQTPAFATDAKGALHLYFASNRTGDDYSIYHCTLSNGTWSAPEAIADTTGASDLAVIYANNQFVLAEETLGAGLVVSTSTDGTRFSGAKVAADAGFAPSLAALPDGRLMLAYMHDGNLYDLVGKPGAWGAEATAATGSDKLQEPGLVWSGDHGVMAYAERTPGGYQLRARRFDAKGQFDASPLPLPASSGDARAPGLATDAQGKIGMIWGMKDDNGQQGTIFSQASF